MDHTPVDVIVVDERHRLPIGRPYLTVAKFRRMHPPVSHPDHEHIPVLAVQMPSEPSVIRFYVALLAAMGAPLRPRPRLAELELPC